MTPRAWLLVPACSLMLMFSSPAAQRPLVRHYTVSGHISGLGTHHALVRMTRPRVPGHTASTHEDGSFTLRTVAPGTYTIRPSHASFTFSPTFRTVAVTSHDVDGVHFTAHAKPRGRR